MKKFKYPQDKNIIQIFEDVVATNSDVVAIQYEDQLIKYKELNVRANQLAHCIKTRGIKPGDKIAILLNRDIDFVVAILAVHKIACCAILLDPDFPDERKKYFIEDSDSKLLITNEKNLFYKGEILLLNNTKNLKSFSGENLKSYGKKDFFPFIFYTSGTTSKPKGVILGQRYFLYGCYSWIDFLGLKNEDVFSINLSIAALPTIFNIYISFFLGARFVVYPDNVAKNDFKLFFRMQQDRISIIEINSAMLSSYLDLITNHKNEFIYLNNLDKIVLGGEKISLDLISRFYRVYKNIKLVVSYGCTEYSTVSANIISSENKRLDDYGEFMTGTEAYIFVDETKELKRTGRGELFLSGDGLAVGYWNDKKLTKDKFVVLNNKLFFKTGDLVEVNSDYNIKVLGRIDNKLMIKGYSVNPDEIIKQVKKLSEINECVIKEYNHKLVLYYKLNNNIISSKKIKKHLELSLPNFMVPTYFFLLIKMPRTPNGKISLESLPSPTEKNLIKEKFINFKSDYEFKMFEIWKKVLSVEEISAEDDFFSLGGDSIITSNLIFSIKKEFEYEINFLTIFKFPILRSLAKHIEYCQSKNQKELLTSTPVFGAMGDFIINNGINDYDSFSINFINNIDFDIFLLILKRVSLLYPSINIKIVYNYEHWQETGLEKITNKDLDNYFIDVSKLERKGRIKKISQAMSSEPRCIGKEFKFYIFLMGTHVELLIKRNKTYLNNKAVVEFLMKLQQLYNKELLVSKNILSKSQGETLQLPSPVLNYGSPYNSNCLHPTIFEMIQQKQILNISKSVMPAFDFLSLPFYYSCNGNFDKFIDIHTRFLGYEKLFPSLDILNYSYKFVGFDKAEEAKEYFNSSDKKEPLILIGSMKFLPFKRYYKTRDETKKLLRSTFFYPTWLIVSGSIENAPIIYSPQMNYFGRMAIEDFWGFWNYQGVLKESGFQQKFQKRIYGISKNYLAFEIEKINKPRLKDELLLMSALKKNVYEYLRGFVVVGDKYAAFTKLFYGKNAINAYIDDINKERLPDVVLAYKLLETFSPYEYLICLLKDVNKYTDLFFKETSQLQSNHHLLLNEIRIFLDKFNIINKTNIRIDLAALPDEKYFEYSFLSKKEKNKLINFLNNIDKSFYQIFINMKNKLDSIN